MQAFVGMTKNYTRLLDGFALGFRPLGIITRIFASVTLHIYYKHAYLDGGAFLLMIDI